MIVSNKSDNVLLYTYALPDLLERYLEITTVGKKEVVAAATEI